MSDEHTEPVEQAKEEADRQVADLEKRSEQVGERIQETRKDWEAKKQDSAVPGAAGDPDRAEEGGRHPETAYPGKGPDDEVSSEDPTDNDRGTDDAPSDDEPDRAA